MPNMGIAPVLQSWLTKWEQAQAARFAAWTGSPSYLGGATAVVGTAGAMLKGVSPAFDSTFASVRSRLLGGTRHNAIAGRYGSAGSYPGGLNFK